MSLFLLLVERTINLDSERFGRFSLYLCLGRTTTAADSSSQLHVEHSFVPGCYSTLIYFESRLGRHLGAFFQGVYLIASEGNLENWVPV